jgi:prepilin signal peptidase PulO-like enzyme (type II secretory pathway)
MEFVLSTVLGAGLFLILNYYFKNGRSTLVFCVIGAFALSAFFFLLFHNFPLILFIVLIGFYFNLVLLSLEDIKNLSVTDWQIAAFGVTALTARIFIPLPLVSNILSVAAGFLMFFIPYLITRKKGVGIGDVLVFTGCALLFTLTETILVFLFTGLTALIYAVLRYVFLKKKDRIPLIPFIALSTVLTMGLRDFIIPLLGLSDLYNMQFLY